MLGSALLCTTSPLSPDNMAGAVAFRTCKHLLRLPPVWEDEERQSDKVSVIKCFITTVRIVEIKNYGYLYSQQ